MLDQGPSRPPVRAPPRAVHGDPRLGHASPKQVLPGPGVSSGHGCPGLGSGSRGQGLGRTLLPPSPHSFRLVGGFGTPVGCSGGCIWCWLDWEARLASGRQRLDSRFSEGKG